MSIWVSIADTSKNTISPSPQFRNATTVVDASDVAKAMGVSLVAVMAKVRAEFLEGMAFAAVSEDSFAEDWDSPEDAIYNDLS